MSKIAKFKEDFNRVYARVNSSMNKKFDTESGVLDGSSVGSIVGFAIALIVLASVAPTALDSFYNTNTSSWKIDGQEDTKTVALWWLMPLIVVAVVLILIYEKLR